MGVSPCVPSILKIFVFITFSFPISFDIIHEIGPFNSLFPLHEFQNEIDEGGHFTPLRPPEGFDFQALSLNKRYTVTLERERAFPLHIAILLIDKEWNFYGYAVAHSALVKDKKTQIEFELITLFNKEEQGLYKNKFIEAGKITGEVK